MAWRRRMGGLIVWDFALSFMWAWAGSLTKLFVYSFLDWGRTPAAAEAMKLSISVLYMYFFAWMGNLSRGGAYNPLTVLSSAFMGGLDGFLFNLFGRIPAQVSKYHLSRIWVWIWNGFSLDCRIFKKSRLSFSSNVELWCFMTYTSWLKAATFLPVEIYFPVEKLI